MLSLDEIKLYLRLDGDDYDAELQRLVESVKAFMISGVGEGLDFSDPLSQQGKLMLMAHWFENRGITGDETQIPLGYNSIVWLLQAKYGGVANEVTP